MFEKLIRELENLNNKITVPINADAEGYLDKECPSKECLFTFKVKEEDWKNIAKEEVVYCPMCGHNAPKKSFWTTEQLDKAKKEAVKFVKGKINAALVEGASEFNRSQDKNSFIKISMSVTGTSRQYCIVPISAKEEFERKLKCDECNTNYAVIGSAFFCPCCGNNSVEKTLDESLSKVEIKLKNISIIKEALSKDDAEITCRSLIETGLNDCIVAFQRFCEATFIREMPLEKLPINVFQRLDDGSKFWKKIFNEGYEDWLTVNELKRMNIFFQRRHLLSHSEGLVDEKYLLRANDMTYKLSQRIVVKENDVLELLLIVKKIVAKIRELKNK